jgi:hypothetical protein
MKQIYIPILAFLFISCSTRINYVGNRSTPTKEVDVFVTESAIKKPFDVSGRGFINAGNLSHFNRRYHETVQEKAIEKARSVGADAVLIQEQWLLLPGSQISSVYRTDSIGRGVVTAGQTSVSPNLSSEISIFFLKYR